jgi:cytidine deaminase
VDDELRARLIEKARAAQRNAYAPYSRFSVGAALLAKDGSVYCGCNIENSSYPATICAERVAMYKAVSEGQTAFAAMAVTCDSPLPCAPCGVCRQVMMEFAPEMRVLMVGKETVLEQLVRDLLPFSFGADHMSHDRDE